MLVLAAPAALAREAAPRDGLAGIEVPGAQKLVVDDWGGLRITLWYLRPADASADAPVLFVMHGLRRDADRYLSEWRDIALRHSIIVAVPEFSQKYFPGARAYNHGGIFDKKGRVQPRERWSYSAIEPLFERLRAHERLSTPSYGLFGHSAGAQFVHRFVMLGGGSRMAVAIAANAGSYLFPVADVDWPFGLRGAPTQDPAKLFTAPMLLMLGDADSDPQHPSLPRQPEALLQGAHRLERGRSFYAAAREAARARGTPFEWSCVLVPGVAHENAGMARAAIAFITEPTLRSPGADCALR